VQRYGKLLEADNRLQSQTGPAARRLGGGAKSYMDNCSSTLAAPEQLFADDIANHEGGRLSHTPAVDSGAVAVNLENAQEDHPSLMR